MRQVGHEKLIKQENIIQSFNEMSRLHLDIQWNKLLTGVNPKDYLRFQMYETFTSKFSFIKRPQFITAIIEMNEYTDKFRHNKYLFMIEPVSHMIRI